jgi:hypothetical protein
VGAAWRQLRTRRDTAGSGSALGSAHCGGQRAWTSEQAHLSCQRPASRQSVSPALQHLNTPKMARFDFALSIADFIQFCKMNSPLCRSNITLRSTSRSICMLHTH